MQSKQTTQECAVVLTLSVTADRLRIFLCMALLRAFWLFKRVHVGMHVQITSRRIYTWIRVVNVGLCKRVHVWLDGVLRAIMSHA